MNFLRNTFLRDNIAVVALVYLILSLSVLDARADAIVALSCPPPMNTTNTTNTVPPTIVVDVAAYIPWTTALLYNCSTPSLTIILTNSSNNNTRNASVWVDTFSLQIQSSAVSYFDFTAVTTFRTFSLIATDSSLVSSPVPALMKTALFGFSASLSVMFNTSFLLQDALVSVNITNAPSSAIFASAMVFDFPFGSVPQDFNSVRFDIIMCTIVITAPRTSAGFLSLPSYSMNLTGLLVNIDTTTVTLNSPSQQLFGIYGALRPLTEADPASGWEVPMGGGSLLYLSYATLVGEPSGEAPSNFNLLTSEELRMDSSLTIEAIYTTVTTGAPVAFGSLIYITTDGASRAMGLYVIMHQCTVHFQQNAQLLTVTSTTANRSVVSVQLSKNTFTGMNVFGQLVQAAASNVSLIDDGSTFNFSTVPALISTALQGSCFDQTIVSLFGTTITAAITGSALYPAASLFPFTDLPMSIRCGGSASTMVLSLMMTNVWINMTGLSRDLTVVAAPSGRMPPNTMQPLSPTVASFITVTITSCTFSIAYDRSASASSAVFVLVSTSPIDLVINRSTISIVGAPTATVASGDQGQFFLLSSTVTVRNSSSRVALLTDVNGTMQSMLSDSTFTAESTSAPCFMFLHEYPAIFFGSSHTARSVALWMQLHSSAVEFTCANTMAGEVVPASGSTSGYTGSGLLSFVGPPANSQIYAHQLELDIMNSSVRSTSGALVASLGAQMGPVMLMAVGANITTANGVFFASPPRSAFVTLLPMLIDLRISGASQVTSLQMSLFRILNGSQISSNSIFLVSNATITLAGLGVVSTDISGGVPLLPPPNAQGVFEFTNTDALPFAILLQVQLSNIVFGATPQQVRTSSWPLASTYFTLQASSSLPSIVVASSVSMGAGSLQVALINTTLVPTSSRGAGASHTVYVAALEGTAPVASSMIDGVAAIEVMFSHLLVFNTSAADNASSPGYNAPIVLAYDVMSPDSSSSISSSDSAGLAAPPPLVLAVSDYSCTALYATAGSGTPSKPNFSVGAPLNNLFNTTHAEYLRGCRDVDPMTLAPTTTTMMPSTTTTTVVPPTTAMTSTAMSSTTVVPSTTVVNTSTTSPTTAHLNSSTTVTPNTTTTTNPTNPTTSPPNSTDTTTTTATSLPSTAFATTSTTEESSTTMVPSTTTTQAPTNASTSTTLPSTTTMAPNSTTVAPLSTTTVMPNTTIMPTTTEPNTTTAPNATTATTTAAPPATTTAAPGPQAVFFVLSTVTDTTLMSRLQAKLALDTDIAQPVVMFVVTSNGASSVGSGLLGDGDRNTTLGFAVTLVRDRAVQYANQGSLVGVVSAAPVNPTAPASADDGGSNVGAIVGGVVGGVAFLVIIVVVFCCCCGGSGRGSGSSKNPNVPASHVRFDDDFVMAQAVGSGVMANMEELLLAPIEMDSGPNINPITGTVVVVDPKDVAVVVVAPPVQQQGSVRPPTNALATTGEEVDGVVL